MFHLNTEKEIAKSFEDLLSDISRVAKHKLNVDLYPYTNYSMNVFKSLPEEIRAKIMDQVAEIATILNEATIIELNSGSAIRGSLKRRGLRVPEEFWNEVRDGDVIEVYNNQNMPVVQNLEFIRLSSYDMMTLLTHPLDKLFERDPSILTAVVNQVMEIRDHAEPWRVPEHTVVERLDKHRRYFLIKPRWVSPVFSQTGERFGWISSIQVKLLGSPYEGSNVVPI